MNLGDTTGLSLTDGDFILATATDDDNNTSEFSYTPQLVVDARFLVNATNAASVSSPADA